MKNLLSNTELLTTGETCDQLEARLKKDWGLHRLSGGFVSVDMKDYDDNSIYLTCRAGVQNDVEDDVKEYGYTINRKTMTLID